MRIYIVKTNGDGKVVRYVRAANQASAIRAVMAERYSASVATTEDIYAAAKAGTLEVLDAAPAVDDGPVVVDPRDAANMAAGVHRSAAEREPISFDGLDQGRADARIGGDVLH